MLTLILCTITAGIVGLYILIHRGRGKNRAPGPYPWPVLGNLRQLKKLSQEHGGQHKAFVELARTYKSNVITLQLGRLTITVVNGFEGISQVLRDEIFDARPWNEFMKIRNMGLRKGITMTDGEEWREMRAWLVRCLRNLGFGRETMSSKISDELKIVLDKLELQTDTVVVLPPIIAPTVINVIWSITTGRRIEKESQLQYFRNLMTRRAAAFDMAGGVLSLFPWIRYVMPESSGYNVLVRLNAELKTFLTEIIHQHKQDYIQGREMDLIDMFLAEMYHGKGPKAGFTEDQLLMILIDIFIAGMHTSAITLDFLFLYMTIFPEVQAKLHAELDAVLGPDRLPDVADRVRLPYTDAVITESQRLRMVVPVIGPRRTVDETTLEGYKIPKNSYVLMNVYSIHMDPKNFEDPHEFRPERFIENGAFVPDKKLTFFGGGHRRCPGEAVAKSAVFLLFAGIMKRFQIVPAPGCDFSDIEPLPGLTISPKPYKVKLNAR